MSGAMKQEELIRWIKEWSGRRIFGNKDIKRFLGYDDFSFWWFFDFYIYNRLMKFNSQGVREKQAGKSMLAVSYILLRTIMRKLYGVILMRPEGGREPTIFILSHPINWRRKADGRSQDQLFSGIMDELEKKPYRILGIDRAHTLNFKILGMKRRQEEGRWTPIEYYIGARDILEALRINNRIRRKYRKLSKDMDFQKRLTGDKPEFEEVLQDILDLAFKYIPLEAWLHARAVMNAVERENGKLIVLSHEYGTFGKSAIIAGRRIGAPTIAVQHGVIHQYHMGYVHTEEEVGARRPEHCPMPDKMAVYGQFSKDILVNHGKFSPDTVEIVGQPKYDALSNPEKQYNREQFLKSHGLDPGKKTLLLTTQPFPVMKHRVEFLRYMLRHAVPEIQIMIKPHPGENREWHRSIIREEKKQAVVLEPRSDIYECIYASDIVSTVTSTTATEAIILDKDVLIFNMTGMEEPIPYVKSGAALGIYHEERIEEGIRAMIHDEDLKTRLAQGRERFLERHIRKTDSGSTKEFVTLVTSALDESQQ